MRTELLPANGRVLCAVSGGADSMALLHLLLAREELTVCAAHFEHGLRGAESEADAAFVESWCRERGVRCLVGHGDTRTYAREHGLGLEEAARELRYAFLEEAADALGCNCIATAHTADDNAETLLFHLLRGSGTEGLRGIPPRRGRIVRPLLDTTRAEIEGYLREHGVAHIEDTSNADERFSRNRLRRRVMPELRALNPRASEAMGRAARLLERDADCLDGLARDFLDAHYNGESLAAAQLCALHPALASRAVRLLWPESLSFEQTEAVLRFAAGTEYGLLSLPGGTLRRERGRLWPGGEAATARLPERALPRDGSLALPEAGLVIFCESAVKSEEIHGLFKTYELKCDMIGKTLLCTGPREGDRFHPAGRGCGKSLKALFAERGLTRRERALVPVLRDGRGVLAVLGFGQDERTLARPGDRILRICWTEAEVPIVKT